MIIRWGDARDDQFQPVPEHGKHERDNILVPDFGYGRTAGPNPGMAGPRKRVPRTLARRGIVLPTEVVGPDGVVWHVREVRPYDEGPSVLIFKNAEETRWAWGQPIAWWRRSNLEVLLDLARPLPDAA